MKEGWTPADINLLSSYIKAGMSSNTVADLMGRSRSGVIGKASRLGLVFGNGKPGPRTERKSKATPKANPTLPRRAATKSGPVGGVPFMERNPFQCSYIIDDTYLASMCCGAPVFRYSVCEVHHKLTREAASNGRPKSHRVQSDGVRLSSM